MSMMEVRFSQLLQHPRETVAKLERSHGRRLKLIRRDGEDLMLESARRAEADEAGVLLATRLLFALLKSEDAAELVVAALAEAIPWVRFLPDDEAREFTVEFAETARACAELGSLAGLAPVIESWRATAEVHADPELLKTLTAPLDGSDHGPVPEVQIG
jgi:hypothetical protein